MSPASRADSGLGFAHPQLALWATNIPSASPTDALADGRATAPILLLNLLQQPIGVIAGDEWDAFVREQLF
jgi:hypothetical protein